MPADNDTHENPERGVDEEQSTALLRNILHELKTISSHLKTQDERLQSLEWRAGQSLSSTQVSSGSTNEPTSDSSPQPRVQPPALSLEEALRIYSGDLVKRPSPESSFFRLTRIGKLDAEESQPLLVLGDLCRLPFDGRLSLGFQKHVLDLSGPTKVRQCLWEILNFHEQLKARPPLKERDLHHYRNYFVVSDWFGPGTGIEYRVGVPRTVIAPLKETLDMVKGKDYLVAPWRRMIQLQGLCSVKQTSDWLPLQCPFFEYPTGFMSEMTSKISAAPASHHPYPLSGAEDLGRATYANYYLWMSITRHLKCQPRRSTDAAMSKGIFGFFHVTFYEIVILPLNADPRHTSWRKGKLYNDEPEYWPEDHITRHGTDQRTRSLRESAYTIFAVSAEPSANSAHDSPYETGSQPYWTILELSPEHFHADPHVYNEDWSPTSSCPPNSSNMIHAIAKLVERSTSLIIDRWGVLLFYFENLFNERDAFLDPEFHDSLLSDDTTFSRSKKYFWAIDVLKELDKSIQGNVDELGRFVERYGTDESGRRMVGKGAVLEILEGYVKRLENMQAALREKREEAVALRDGLFSASAVVESRASTRLGEHVKLLTFVSVFFLPLSFCTSLWSINDEIFSLAALIPTVICAAIATYLAIFNINNMALAGRSLYTHIVDRVITSMQNDRSEAWKARGRRFGKLRPLRAREESLSSWRILQYVARRIVLLPWGMLSRAEKDGREVRTAS